MIIPFFVVIILIIGTVKKVPCFESFVNGASEGVKTIIKLLPSLIGLIVAIGVFRESGILEAFIELLKPFLDKIGLSADLFPLVMIRPISGSASLATLRDIMESCGVNSTQARAACVMMGSTETILYTMAVYTGKTNIKKLPGVLPAALTANFVSALAAEIICQFI